MSERLNEKDSMALYFVRAIAILTSVAAHVRITDYSTALNEFFSRAWDMSSCLSVPCFLIIGGILYSRKEADGRNYWRKKAQSLILPWLFCGMLTYGYRAIFEGGSLLGLICWLVGHGSWLYYVTVYLVLMFIFKPIRNNVPALWACVAVTAVQLVLKSKDSGVPSPLDNDYLNLLHWIGFFALGILLRRRGLRLNKVFLAGCFVVFIVSAVWVYHKHIYNYFHIINAVYTVSGFFVLLTIGRQITGAKLCRGIRAIGTSTYCIYLLHMLIVPPILRRIPGITFKTVFGPVIGVIVLMLLIDIGKRITAKLPFGDKLRMLVGVR